MCMRECPPPTRYDWRFGPERWTQPGAEFDRLQAAIEGLSKNNSGAPVVVVTQSLGAPLLSLFLAGMTPAWRKRHLARHVSMSGVFAGDNFALAAALAADAQFVSVDDFRWGFGRVMRTFPCVVWLAVGSPSVPFWANSTVAETPSRKYRPSELGAFLQQACAKAGYRGSPAQGRPCMHVQTAAP